MLTSNKSNTVFYSALSFNDFRPEVEKINNCLSKQGIDFVPLTGTEDYFCRDYMPIQKDEHTLVQFKFKPDYLLNNPRLKDFVTDPKLVLKKNSFLNKFEIINSDIVLDGGNLVHSAKTAIITDKIQDSNPGYTLEELKQEIGELLGVKVIIVPALKDDETGHVDGILQFINENTVLTVFLDDEDVKWKNKLLNALKEEGINVISLPLLPNERDNQWAYVNFLHVGNLIILPALNEQNDKLIQEFFKTHLLEKEICFVDFNRIVQQGGAVNCFTWDILGGFSNDELKITEHKYLRRYPINPKHSRLILGTIHPHNVSDFDMQFFYGNKCTLWKIFHDAFPGLMPDAVSEDDLKAFLDTVETSISDVVVKCKRLSDSASDEDFIPIQLNNALLKQIKKSNIDEIFFTSGFDKNNAFKLFYEDILKLKITAKIKVERQVILPKRHFGRPVKLTILYSPSGAANRALKKTSLYKLNEDKYKQFPKPVEQFKIDYYKEKFGYMGKKMAQLQESINEGTDFAEIILTDLPFARKDQFLC